MDLCDTYTMPLSCTVQCTYVCTFVSLLKSSVPTVRHSNLHVWLFNTGRCINYVDAHTCIHTLHRYVDIVYFELLCLDVRISKIH